MDTILKTTKKLIKQANQLSISEGLPMILD